jgi:alpha-galactosidase
VPTYGRPTAVTDANGTYVAVRTADDSVWWRVKSAAGTWGNWTSLGGVVSGSPTLLATGGGIYLFDRAGDYTLWQRTYTSSSSSWGGWTQRTEFGSDNFAGAVGVADGASGTAWTVVSGRDGHVHQLVL